MAVDVISTQSAENNDKQRSEVIETNSTMDSLSDRRKAHRTRLADALAGAHACTDAMLKHSRPE